MSRPTVSVLIRVWNCERYVGPAIDSILAQTFQDFEVVVVNDASTDGTEAILKAYAQRDERIKLVNNESNQGPVKTMNIALRQARGELVAVQDSDDLSVPRRLETQVRFLNANPNIALVGGGSYAIDEEDEEFASRRWPRRRMGPQEVRQHLETENTFTHSSLMFRRECIEAIDLYDEFFLYAHDYDMLIRMAENFDTVYYEEPLVNRRCLSSGITARKKHAQAAFAKVARARSRAQRKGIILDLQEEFNRLMIDENLTSDRYGNQSMSDANHYYSIGMRLLDAGKARQARRRFLKAWKHRCTMSLRLRVLTWYLLSFFPNISTSKLMRVVRQMV